MKQIIMSLSIGILSLSSITAANAGMLVVDNYVFHSSPSNAQVQYLDPGNTELTDGDISLVGWGTGITAAQAYKYVGWQYQDPIIEFNFASIVSLGSLTLWADDANGAAGVALPTQVTISMGGTTVVRSISNPAGSAPVGINFDNLNLTGDSLLLTVARSAQWTMISEVQFASPVPVPGAFWLFGSGLLGLIGMSRKRS